jgi:hypothetical protein
MDIVNRARVEEAIVRDIAQRLPCSNENFLVFLDDRVNAVRAGYARTKLLEYKAKGWTPLAGWERDVTGENDVHACTVARRIIGRQQLPGYVIETVGEYELLVYLDATWTQAPRMGFVLTLAHELRHAWQYFKVPLVFHSQTPLAWVVPPQLTPCELDAERAAKRVLIHMYGDSGLGAYLDVERTRCSPEHREVIERLATLDPEADSEIEARTIVLLEQHATEIRRLQLKHKFEMPGIPELSDALRGRSNALLRP